MTRLPSLGPRGEGWVVLQLVLLPLVVLSGLIAPRAEGDLAQPLMVAGLVLMIAGALLAGRGLYDLGRNLTPVPHPRDGAELVETGIYALARHPIYGGLIVTAFAWGLAAASPSTLALAAVLALFFEAKSRREEAWLAERFPGYTAYMRRTKRFVPRVW